MPVKFSLGQTVATPGVLALTAECGQSPTEFLRRHLSGDWGGIDAEDRQANEDALLDGDRLLRSYRVNNGQKLWIITEADRSSTTLVLPEDY